MSNKNDTMKKGGMPIFDCPPINFNAENDEEKGWTIFAKRYWSNKLIKSHLVLKHKLWQGNI